MSKMVAILDLTKSAKCPKNSDHIRKGGGGGGGGEGGSNSIIYIVLVFGGNLGLGQSRETSLFFSEYLIEALLCEFNNNQTISVLFIIIIIAFDDYSLI